MDDVQLRLDQPGADLAGRGRFVRGGIVAGLLMCQLLVACASGRVPPTASGPSEVGEQAAPSPGLIVGLGPEGDIFVIHGDGSGRMDLTADAAPVGGNGGISRTYLLPTWSPAAQQLAYGSITTGVDGTRRAEVCVRILGEPDPETMFESTSEIPIYLSWSPSGEQLGILTSGDAGSPLGLWIAQAGRSTLIDRGQPYYWDWMSGGQSLVSHVGGSSASNPSDARLSVFPSLMGERVDWSLRPADFLAPAGQPGAGTALVAAIDDAGDQELAIAGEDGQVLQRLAPIEGAIAMAWSPDGQRVAYVEHGPTPHEDFGRLIILQLNDSPLARPIPTSLDSVAAFEWSPKGDQLVAFVPRLSVDSNQQSVANRALQGELQFELQLVQADTGKAELLTVFQPTDAFLARLPFFDQYQRASTIWSPDGRSLTFSARRPGKEDGIFRIEAEIGATASLLAEGGISFWSFK